MKKSIKEIDSLFNKFDSLHHQIAVNQGLSDTTYKILRSILVFGEGITQTTIYKNICLNKQTVNSSVKHLYDKQLIHFESGIGRENKIYLTELGKKTVEEKIVPMENLETDILNEFSEKEVNTFITFANKYLSKLEEKIYKDGE